MSAPPEIKDVAAVIFDMDGLMLDTERIGMQAWAEAGRVAGVEIPETFIKATIGRTVKDIREMLHTSFPADFPVEVVARAADDSYHRQVSQPDIPHKTGIVEILDFLEIRAVPRAVGTSTREDSAMLKLRASRLDRYFDIVVAGDQVPLGKPAPDIFLEAARQLGVAPRQCIVLEDSYLGIQAAHAAGMIPFMVPDALPPTEEIRRLASRIFQSLHDVRLFFEDSGLFTRHEQSRS